MDLNDYKEQLNQINILLSNEPDEAQKTELLSLKSNIEELLTLTNSPEDVSTENNEIDDEYSLFMAEIAKEGAAESTDAEKPSTSKIAEAESLKGIEGKKYRAPHTHQWGETVYHNAMVSTVIHDSTDGDIQVKVLFLNPTHQEMMPCPYFFDTDGDCKFSDKNCRYSHGEIVQYSSLQDYVEPDFESLIVGSSILAKRSDKLWARGNIRSIGTEHCLVQFETRDKKIERILFEDIYPIEGGNDVKNSESEDDMHVENDQDVINMSLLIKPSDQALGQWEKHTKGIGSKLMQKMGYIIGTGLGKDGKGRVEPVTAVVLPPGKSLDHCMNLREKCGGDKNLFSADRKMKRMQRRQEMLNKKAYERESQKTDVFSFMNAALSVESQPSTEDIASYKEFLKKQSIKNLNVTNMIVRENIRKFERGVIKYRDALKRMTDEDSRKRILEKLLAKEDQLKRYQTYAIYINTEQNFRDQKRKMTVF